MMDTENGGSSTGDETRRTPYKPTFLEELAAEEHLTDAQKIVTTARDAGYRAREEEEGPAITVNGPVIGSQLGNNSGDIDVNIGTEIPSADSSVAHADETAERPTKTSRKPRYTREAYDRAAAAAEPREITGETTDEEDLAIAREIREAEAKRKELYEVAYDQAKAINKRYDKVMAETGNKPNTSSHTETTETVTTETPETETTEVPETTTTETAETATIEPPERGEVPPTPPGEGTLELPEVSAEIIKDLDMSREEYIFYRAKRKKWFNSGSEAEAEIVKERYYDNVRLYINQEAQRVVETEFAKAIADAESKGEALTDEAKRELHNSLVVLETLRLDNEEVVRLGEMEIGLNKELEEKKFRKGVVRLIKKHPYVIGFMIGGLAGVIAVQVYKDFSSDKDKSGPRKKTFYTHTPDYFYTHEVENDSGELDIEKINKKIAENMVAAAKRKEAMTQDTSPEHLSSAHLLEKEFDLMKKAVLKEIERLREENPDISDDIVRLRIIRRYFIGVVDDKEALENTTLKAGIKRLIRLS